ncbi:DUF2946 domain-containing protein [Vibrio zhugei]|uniref:DUF2946 domain-containing protein n=1 Tax=Vibrio zhugei TaxID=2479546 RepID=A0ABV7C7P0_9VIBR|nr:DUF2946 domain-containing protein [Vibrio zhugei]
MLLQRFRSTKYQHLVSKLALFAILLIYVAPLISMSIVMIGHHPLMEHSTAQSTSMMTVSSGTPSHHSGWCQYCDLLASLHGATDFALAIIPSMSGLVYMDTPKLLSQSLAKHSTQHRPRAPPYAFSLRLI